MKTVAKKIQGIIEDIRTEEKRQSKINALVLRTAEEGGRLYHSPNGEALYFDQKTGRLLSLDGDDFRQCSSKRQACLVR